MVRWTSAKMGQSYSLRRLQAVREVEQIYENMNGDLSASLREGD